MGWWGYGIMDGDTPMDYRSWMIHDVIGISTEDYDVDPVDLLAPEDVEAAAPIIIRRIQADRISPVIHIPNFESQDIALLVLGHLFLVSDARMTKEQKKLFIDAARAEKTQWEEVGRHAALDEFIDDIGG